MRVRPDFDEIGAHTRIDASVEVFRQGSAEERGVYVGSHCILYPRNRFVLGDLSVNTQADIRIEDHVLINAGGYFSGEGGLFIGEYTLIGPGVFILSAGHEFDDLATPIQQQRLTYGRISIERDVWIGARAIVLQGVTIGQGAVVASGALVREDVPSGAVVAGHPARIVRYRGQRKRNGFMGRFRKAWDALLRG